jgi:signal peptidase II
MRHHHTAAFLLLAAAIILLDWFTKQWASESLTMYRPVEVFSWLNWTLAHNTGAAFSFLSDAGGWQRWFFTVLASVVTVVLVGWLFRLARGQWLTGTALGLLIGGAVGNLIDRLRLGYVVDFVDVHASGWHWPAFNVADSAITCGIAILLMEAVRDTLRERQSKHREQN